MPISARRLSALVLCLVACSGAPDRPRTPPPAQGGAGGDVSTGGSGGGGGNGYPGTGGSGGTSTGGSGGTPTGGSGGGGSGGAGGSVPDAAAKLDSAATGGAGGGPVSGGPFKVVLVYSPDHDAANPSLKGPDGMMDLLSSMKDSHNVVPEMILDNVAKASTLGDRALVIVGPNVREGMVDPAIKNLAVPVMASKDGGGLTALGLGSMMNTQEYLTNVHITIIKADHPLAAGLALGDHVVNLSRNRLVRGGNVGADAIKIATSPTEPTTSWSIFAYDKGGMMAGGFRAPAKRVGFFWHRPAGATEDGKKLFKAAVAWLIQP